MSCFALWHLACCLVQLEAAGDSGVRESRCTVTWCQLLNEWLLRLGVVLIVGHGCLEQVRSRPARPGSAGAGLNSLAAAPSLGPVPGGSMANPRHPGAGW